MRTGQEMRIVKWAVEGVVKGARRRVFHDVRAYVSCREYVCAPQSAREIAKQGGTTDIVYSSLTELLSALSGFFSFCKDKRNEEDRKWQREGLESMEASIFRKRL